jgi:hypothetical protein
MATTLFALSKMQKSEALWLLMRLVKRFELPAGLHRRHQFRYRKSSKFEVPSAIAFPNDEIFVVAERPSKGRPPHHT